MANHNSRKQHNEPMRTQSWHQARENAYDQVEIGFNFTFDWLSRWREIFKPITERSKAKPIESNSGLLLIGTQLETAQSVPCCNLDPNLP